MNLADALKKLYTKLGGTDALPQGTDTCTLVDKIADEVSGGGSSGGGGVLYVDIVTYTEGSTEGKAISNATYESISLAIRSNKYVIGVEPTSGGGMYGESYIPLAGILESEDESNPMYAVNFGSNMFISTTSDGELKKSGDK